jgi:hypothetical protein
MTQRTGVHYSATPDGLAVLDVRRGRGRWRFLDPIGAELWTAVTSGTPADTAIENLTQKWIRRGADAARVRADLTALLDVLSAGRLLEPAQPTEPPDTPPAVFFATTAASSLRHHVAAQAGFALAVALLRCAPMRITIAAARAASRLPGRPATIAQAQALHAAVRHAARPWPGRAACLEESLAAYFAGALTGRRTRWVLGARFLPYGAHAWIETEGAVIGQAEEDRVWPYVPVLRV